MSEKATSTGWNKPGTHFDGPYKSKPCNICVTLSNGEATFWTEGGFEGELIKLDEHSNSIDKV